MRRHAEMVASLSLPSVARFCWLWRSLTGQATRVADPTVCTTLMQHMSRWWSAGNEPWPEGYACASSNQLSARVPLALFMTCPCPSAAALHSYLPRQRARATPLQCTFMLQSAAMQMDAPAANTRHTPSLNTHTRVCPCPAHTNLQNCNYLGCARGWQVSRSGDTPAAP
jgi:hypothetical protein